MPKVRCPHCGKETEFSKENPFRPFCSDRCQLVDLGNWADGRYAIPDADQSPPPTHDEENSQTESDESHDGRVLH